MRGSLKQVFELGPLVVFFYFFIKTGQIQEAILPLMIAAGIAIAGSYLIERKVSPMLLFSTILIFVFGGLGLSTISTLLVVPPLLGIALKLRQPKPEDISNTLF